MHESPLGSIASLGARCPRLVKPLGGAVAKASQCVTGLDNSRCPKVRGRGGREGCFLDRRENDDSARRGGGEIIKRPQG